MTRKFILAAAVAVLTTTALPTASFANHKREDCLTRMVNHVRSDMERVHAGMRDCLNRIFHRDRAPTK
jgi:hypothetical protein